MRTITKTARLPDARIGVRPTAMCEAVQKIRPIKARLTRQDARHLREHLGRCEEIGGGVHVLLGDLIRAKLADAVLVDPDDIGLDVATGYSHVVYARDGRAPKSKLLSHRDYVGTGRFGLSIRTLLGATLLGMKAGQCAPLLRTDGTAGTVELLEVRTNRNLDVSGKAAPWHERPTSGRPECPSRRSRSPDALHRTGSGAIRRRDAT